MKKGTILFAGGGTGGHVLAGIAIAEKWIAAGGAVEFIGSKGGMEEKLIPRAGFELKLLKIGSLNRVGLKRKILTLLQLPFAVLISIYWILKMQPVAVIGVGGYASGPVLVAAALLNKMRFIKVSLKLAILEQNSVPGLTNRWLAKVSDRIYTAFPGTEVYFKGINSKNMVCVGNPVRSQVQAIQNKSLNHKSTQTDSFTLFIFGGSQGAVGMNTVVIEAMQKLISRINNLHIIHQTGERDYIRVKSSYEKLKQFSAYKVEKFIYQMQDCYEKADLVICRAGSSTLSEVALVGRPAIFIPLPTAADNHQEKNALAFSNHGAGWMIPQDSASGKPNVEKLVEQVVKLANHPELLKQTAKKVREFAKPNAAEAIINDLMGH